MIDIAEDDFEGFFEAPFNAYGPESLYVSPMKSDLKRFLSKSDNPLFRGESDIAYFVARKAGKPIGRITAHAHAEANHAHSTNQAYFGYFDCVDDLGVARALLQAAEAWARNRHFDSIAGNYNLTAMQQIGVMTEGFEHPVFTDLVYSPPHICQLLEACGYAREFPMTTFKTDLDESHVSQPLGEKQQRILDDPDFAFASINRSTIAQRIEEARFILNESFAQNPQFLPVTRDEYEFQSKDMKWVMDPRISAVLHYKGKPVACILCIPDLNPILKKSGSQLGPSFIYHFVRHKLRRTRAVLIYSGVLPEWQGKGLNPLVLHRILTNMKRAGYTVCGNTWIGDSNKASLRQKEKMGAKPLHRLHIFRKSLNG